jgi:carbonic anhydrase/acetyltransferase-like protein (isoleucine patch superfamily)
VTVYEFEGRIPLIARNPYVDEDAKVLGDVKIGEQCFVGAGARIRGDYGTIIVGNRTSISIHMKLSLD